MVMVKKNILDNVPGMYKIDTGKMLDLAESAPLLCMRALKLARSQLKKKYKMPKAPKRIVFAGMGGSAIGGEILRDWMIAEGCRIPVEVVRDYSLPEHLKGAGTLLVAVSYSGNTEETLSCFLDALDAGCALSAITSGGRLQEAAQRLNVPLILVPTGIPPRSAIPYLLFSSIVLCEQISTMPIKRKTVSDAVSVLETLSKKLRASSPSNRNPSKKLAQNVKGTIPIVYGFGPYASIASRTKAQFNENGKTVAFSEVFPELNHNATVGWGGGSLSKKCSVIILRDELLESKAISARIETTKGIAFSKNAANVLEIKAKGRGVLARMLSVMYVGDFASIYLAMLKGIDPTPVPVISKLKSILASKTQTIKRIDARIKRL